MYICLTRLTLLFFANFLYGVLNPGTTQCFTHSLKCSIERVTETIQHSTESFLEYMYKLNVNEEKCQVTYLKN